MNIVKCAAKKYEEGGDWSKPSPYPQKAIDTLRDLYLAWFRSLRCGGSSDEDSQQFRTDWIEAIARIVAAWVAENYDNPPYFDGDIYGTETLSDVVEEAIYGDFDEIDPEYDDLYPALIEAAIDLLIHSPSYNTGDDEGYGMSDECVPRFGFEPDGPPEREWTCIDWAKQFKDRRLDLREASRLGTAATRHAKNLGIELNKIPDPRFVSVNVYPTFLLATVWADIFAED